MSGNRTKLLRKLFAIVAPPNRTKSMWRNFKRSYTRLSKQGRVIFMDQ